MINMQYEEHTPVILKCHFLTQQGEEATISGTPTITIKHYNGSSIVTDVSAQNMTQITGTLYYYEWAYATWQTRAYVATYAASYTDGSNVTGSETFSIIKKRVSGGGAVAGVWSPEEKEKLLKEIENLKEGMSQLVSLDDVKGIIEKLQDNIDKIILMVKGKRPELPAKLINELQTIKQSLNKLEKSDELQGKLLINMADLKSLGKILSEVENGGI